MSAETWLTVDLGNTRCKLRSWRSSSDPGPAAQCAADIEGGERLIERLAAWLRGQPRPALAVLSSVARVELEARVRSVLAGSAKRFLEEPDSGLEILCRKPGEVGRDRLFAARGALAHLGRSCIVVDAGTALTVDALVRREDGSGIFLGGAIAPGPALLAEALARKAARLPQIQPRPSTRGLGRDTQEALLAGVGVGFRGAARELIETVAREADLSAAPVVLTGGARDFLLQPEPIALHELVLLPDAVHLGLLAAAGIDLRREAGTGAAPPRST